MCSLDTNLRPCSGEEVHYQVTAGPRWGEHSAGQPVTSFTQQDLLEKAILYNHNGSLSPRGHPGLSVEAGLCTRKPPCKWPLPS